MKRVVVAILVMLLPTVCMAETETARDAIIALTSLVKLTANGSSYQAYAYCLGEVKAEVDAYLKGDEAKRNKKLTEEISEVMGLYEYADTLFKIIDDSKGVINFGADASPRDKKITSEYFSRFPEDKKDISAGGVVVNQHGPKLKINAAISKIFNRAALKYANAGSMLPKQ